MVNITANALDREYQLAADMMRALKEHNGIPDEHFEGNDPVRNLTK